MTMSKTTERKEYLEIDDILRELKAWLQNNPEEAKNLSYITLSGAGEPTLNIKIGELIPEIKRITGAQVAIITNASLLNNPGVRQELLGADLIVPSLDAVTEEVFRELDRPKEDIKIEDIINGLINLRREFRGKIWLEVMLVKGINDSLTQMRKLKDVVDRIRPDKIHLNSPVRSTAESNIFPVGTKKLDKIREILGDKCEVV
jgi:wyosine [tRNA(Phe)-imidazoG37] synthetase (radical SAM superfamily)